MKINQHFQLCSFNLILIFENIFRQKLSLWIVYTTIPTLPKKSPNWDEFSLTFFFIILIVQIYFYIDYTLTY